MGIFSDIEQRSTSAQIGPPRDPAIAEWFGQGSLSNAGVNVTADNAMRVTAVFRCVAILSQTFASLPLQVFKQLPDGGKEIDKKHPLYSVLHDQPNEFQTSFEWREMMIGHFALRGACYSEIVSSGGKVVEQLIPLHPDRVYPFKAPDGRIAFNYYPENGNSRVILQDEMHYMHLLAFDGIKPLSPIGMARESVGLALATEEHGARLFSNGTRMSGILKMPGHLKDDPARERLRKSWHQAQGGLRNAHKVALLEDGIEWQSIGMTSEDAQFLETRNYQLAEIARIFGIPPHKIADLSRSTNNNIEHQGIEFVQDTIRPGAVRHEQAMRRDLFSSQSRQTHTIEYNLDGLMRGDSAARTAYYTNGIQWGWLSPDEARRKENMNPRKDGLGGKYLQPMNMIQTGDTDAGN